MLLSMYVLYTTDQELMVKGAKIHNHNTPKHAYYTTDQGCTVFAKIQNHNTTMVHNHNTSVVHNHNTTTVHYRIKTAW